MRSRVLLAVFHTANHTALMCVCACGGHVGTHICTSMWKPEVSLRFAPHAASKNRTGSLTGLERSKQARLAGRRAPGTYISPYPQYWGYKQVAPCLAALWVLGIKLIIWK